MRHLKGDPARICDLDSFTGARSKAGDSSVS